MADLALHARQMVPRRTGDRQHPILNFDQADNFVVAYYAGGDETPKALPFAEESVEIESEPGVINAARLVRTGGGTYVEGDVNITNGDFVGRDKIIHNHPPAPDPLIEQAKRTEASYLRVLRRDCNRLPLAEDERSQTGPNQRRAQLSNVYVDLQTMTKPTPIHVFDRLGVPEADRSGLQQAIKNWRAEKANLPDISPR